MHKKKLSKHRPVLVKTPRPRNPVVKAMITHPKRNAGVHRKPPDRDAKGVRPPLLDVGLGND
jgi:hypothetical protein